MDMILSGIILMVIIHLMDIATGVVIITDTGMDIMTVIMVVIILTLTIITAKTIIHTITDTEDQVLREQGLVTVVAFIVMEAQTEIQALVKGMKLL